MSVRVNRNPAYWSIRTTVPAGSSTGSASEITRTLRSAVPLPVDAWTPINRRSARFQTGCEIVMKVSYLFRAWPPGPGRRVPAAGAPTAGMLRKLHRGGNPKSRAGLAGRGLTPLSGPEIAREAPADQ